jgi:hypothetical protein
MSCRPGLAGALKSKIPRIGGRLKGAPHAFANPMQGKGIEGEIAKGSWTSID